MSKRRIILAHSSVLSLTALWLTIHPATLSAAAKCEVVKCYVGEGPRPTQGCCSRCYDPGIPGSAICWESDVPCSLGIGGQGKVTCTTVEERPGRFITKCTRDSDGRQVCRAFTNYVPQYEIEEWDLNNMSDQE